jgi:hypothetical protein
MIRSIHSSIMLQPLLEAPHQEEHVHLTIERPRRRARKDQPRARTLTRGETRTWQPMSAKSEPMKAALRLEKPAAQNPLGMLLVVCWVVADGSQSCPPLSHSHWILSFLKSEKVAQGSSDHPGTPKNSAEGEASKRGI